MRNKLAPGLFLLLISPLIASVATSAEKLDFQNFFEKYQSLTSAFDVTVIQLYADDATITGARKGPDGKEETMTITGQQWKNIIISSMDNAKKVGDHSKYSDINIDVESNTAKITATRYSSVDCFTDKRFSMVVEASGNDQLKIVEQFMESPVQSNCEEQPGDLTEFLQTTVKMINQQLPAEIDAETRLIKTSSDGSNLRYHYVLFNHTTATIATEDAKARLAPLTVQQSCNSPNLRPILDQGGSLTYIYNGIDQVQIVKLDVDKSACGG